MKALMQSDGRLSVGLAVAVALLIAPAVADAATHPIAPEAITTTAGSTGGQPVGNLAVKDQTGSQDNWNKYVEFGPSGSTAYAGYRTYTLPGAIDPTAIAAMQVEANYRGPAPAQQRWSWSIYNWTTSTWVVLGDNTGAPSWGAWKLLSFSAPGTLANYVRATDRKIRVRLTANNATDYANIDYESVKVTTDEEPPPGGLWHPPLQARWQYQLAGNPSFASTGGINVNICSIPYTGGPCQTPEVFDIDLYVAEDIAGNNTTPNTAAVNAIHANGDRAICYIDAGGIEYYRPDFAAFASYDAAHGGALLGPWVDGYVDLERWADLSEQPEREFMVSMMDARVEKCALAGFDGVEYDLIDAYDIGSHEETEEMGITYADQIAYNEALADVAHEHGLSVALKNDVAQVPDLVDDFDYAVNEQCLQYDECDNLAQFVSAGKPVFQVEYHIAPATFCPAANTTWNFNSIKKGASEDSLDTPYTPCR